MLNGEPLATIQNDDTEKSSGLEFDVPDLPITERILIGAFIFGIIGLFIGPVVLAVSHVLLKAWVSEGDAAPASSDSESEGREK